MQDARLFPFGGINLTAEALSLNVLKLVTATPMVRYLLVRGQVAACPAGRHTRPSSGPEGVRYPVHMRFAGLLLS